MNHRLTATVSCLGLAVCLAGTAGAQAPAPAAAPPPAQSGSAVAAPTYVTIPLEITVDRPAAEVWKRIGKYCDIAEWFQVACTITSGKDGEVGAVRSVANEVLVGKTELSVHLHAARPRGPTLQPLSRDARGAAAHGDDVEAAVHARLRQLDVGRRCGPREGQGIANGDIYACPAEHEDPGRGRDPATPPAARRRTWPGRKVIRIGR